MVSASQYEPSQHRLFERRGSNVAAVVLTSLLVVSALAGCSQTVGAPTSAVSPSNSTSPSGTSTPRATGTTSASPEPSPSPSASSGAVAVKVPCNSLVSLQTIYNFNSNFTLSPSFTPPAGTPGAVARASAGEACGWINNTNNATLVVSASRPGTRVLAAAKSALSGGTPVADLGDVAYFSVQGEVGRLDSFSGTAWVTATSTYFSAAADALPLVASGLAALK